MKSDKDNYIKKEIFKIKGMTCHSCELRIENSLKKQNGIKSVKVSLAKSQAEISYNNEEINPETIKKLIEELGYNVIDKSGNIEKNKNFNIGQLIGFAVIIIALWMILNKTGIFNIIPEINESMNYGILFIVGLLTSIHCIAMCGGINLTQSIAKDNEDNNQITYKKFLPGLLYNSGRILSYTVVGGIVGAIGSIIKISGKAQGLIVIIAGFFMIIMAVNLLGLFPWLSKITPRMPKFIGNFLFNIKKNNKGPFIVGLLNGLMPCGPLQSMQLYALATGSFLTGALSMFIFSLGTVPLMMGFSVISSLLNQKFASRMLKISALLILFLGVGMIGRGFSLSGINFKGNINQKKANISKLENNIQIVESNVYNSGYEPIIVQKGVPVKWTIKVSKDNLNGCNNPITIPKYNIVKKLYPGDNIIEFTPDSSGNITITCWMGMISSTIKVVDDIVNVNAEDINDVNKKDSNYSNCCSLGNNKSIISENDYMDPANAKIGLSKRTGESQSFVMDAGISGFNPNVIILQKGLKTKWIINVKEVDSKNNNLLVSDYNAKINLAKGENFVDFIPETDFGFENSDGSFKGYVAIVNDITSFDIEEINKRIKYYQPGLFNKPKGGGCCN